MCLESSLLYPVTEGLSYITEVVFPPVLLTGSILGNTLLFIVCCRHYLRCTSSIYIYISALAVLDLIVALAGTAKYVRDSGILPLQISHGLEFTYTLWIYKYLISTSFEQAACWLVVLLGAVQYSKALRVRANLALYSLATESSNKKNVKESKSKEEKRSAGDRLTRISTSRIIAFVVVVSCLLLNFIELLTTKVVLLTEHGCETLELYSVNRTLQTPAIGYLRDHLMPVVITFLGHVLPITILILLFLLLLCHGIGCESFTKKDSVILRTPQSRGESYHQISMSVLLILIISILFQAPTAVLYVLNTCFHQTTSAVPPNWLYYYALIAQCLALVRCTSNFCIVSLTNHEFRLTFRRTFCCCCCADNDEYYEISPCFKCCGSSDKDEEKSDGFHEYTNHYSPPVRKVNVYESVPNGDSPYMSDLVEEFKYRLANKDEIWL